MKPLRFYILIGVITIFLKTNLVDCIIRNDITNRCIHLRKATSDAIDPRLTSGGQTLLVYATACSWDTMSGTNSRRNSNPDQWLELVPTTITDGNEHGYVIRKVTNETEPETCLDVMGNQPDVSNSCFTPTATFHIDRVEQKNSKGQLISLRSFKIRNNAGQCLTVVPGKAVLKFKECSLRAGLFQVWSVCRHTQQCDVDVTWTPREIEFPINSSSSSSSSSSTTLANKTRHANNSASPHESKNPGHSELVVNEVLYSIQNAMRIYDSSDHFITATLSAFYSLDSLNDAVSETMNVCTDESLTCDPCLHPPAQKAFQDVVTGWLMRWMSQCNSNGSDGSPKTFLSKDVLQVPLHLFPSSNPSHLRQLGEEEKLNLIIPSLKKYLHKLEALAQGGDEGESTSTHSPISLVSTPTTTTTPESLQFAKVKEANITTAAAAVTGITRDDNNATNANDTHEKLGMARDDHHDKMSEDVLELIDVRLEVPKKKGNATTTVRAMKM